LFNSSVSGGTSPYSYQWYLDGAGVSGATSMSWTFTPGSSGSYTVYLNVTDAVGDVEKSNIAPVTVNSALSVSISPTTAVMDVGQSQLFNSSVSGGTSPFSYQWYLNNAAVSGATNATWAFVPFASGSYTVYVVVTDGASTAASATSNTADVTVDPQLTVSISPSNAAIYLSQSQNFTAAPSGGTSPYTYQWYENTTLVSGATSRTWTFTPISTGTYIICAKVTDSAGEQATSDNSTVNVGMHDVTVTNLLSSENVVVEGESINVNITVRNEGTYTETFNVTLSGTCDGHSWVIWTFTGVTLTPGSTTTLTITDLHLGVGFYTLSAQVSNAYVNRTYTGVIVWVAPLRVIISLRLAGKQIEAYDGLLCSLHGV